MKRLSVLLVLAACGGSQTPGRVADSPALLGNAPFGAMTNRVERTDQVSSGAGAGLSMRARPIRRIFIQTGDNLRLGWLDTGVLGYRDWDGTGWSDSVVAQVLNEDGARIRAADSFLGAEGAVSIGSGGEGWQTLPRPEILIERDGDEVAYDKALAWTVAVDPEGRAVVAYFAGGAVAVQRWDGDEWQWLGEPVVPKSYKQQARIGPSLAFDADGDPIVAWRQPYTQMPDGTSDDRYKTRRWRTKVRRWDGSDWESIAGEKSTLDESPGKDWPQQRPGDERNLRAEWEAGQNQEALIAVSPKGRVVVGWQSMGKVLLWERKQKGWVKLAEPANGDAGDEGVSLHWSDDNLVVAFSQSTKGKAHRRAKEIVVGALVDGAWRPIGGAYLGASATDGPSAVPKLFSHGDRLGVAWLDTTSGAPELMAAVFDGQKWQALGALESKGGLGDPTLRSSDARMVVQGETPRLSWVEEHQPGLPSGPTTISFASFEANTWTVAKPLKLPNKPARYDVQWAENGAPAVLWESRAGRTEKGLFVTAWGEKGWRRLKGRGEAGGLVVDAKGAYDADMTLDGEGRPWIIWSHDGRVPQVRQWSGTQWVVVGKLQGPSRGGARPHIAFDRSGGRAWAMWQGKTSNRTNDLRIASFDGQQWQNVGDMAWVNCEANIGGEEPRNPVFDLNEQGNPVVAWVTVRPATKKKPAKQSIHVCSFDGDAWQTLPGPSVQADLVAPGRDPNRSLLSLSAKGGITLAWTHLDELGRQVHSERWNGTEWLQLGETDGDLSTCRGACSAPVVAVGKTTCVAWEEMALGGTNISVDCQQ